jgi:hypothetical protein
MGKDQEQRGGGNKRDIFVRGLEMELWEKNGRKENGS